MKHLLKLIVTCGLLIVTGKGFSQAPGVSQGQSQTVTIAQGASVVLSATTSNAAAYQWYKDGTPISGAINAAYTATGVGTYYVIAFNAQGCQSVKSDDIIILVTPSTVPPVTLPPFARFSFPHLTKPVTPVDLMVNIQSTNSKPAVGASYSYIFTANNNSKIDGTNVLVTYVLPSMLAYVPDAADTTVSYDTTTRKLTWKIATLKQNDRLNLKVNVRVIQSGEIRSEVFIKGDELDPIMENNLAKDVEQVDHLNVPNVFTPNGDGVNDAFYIPGLDTYSETQLSVINRWGSTVFEKANYQNDWTGDGLPEGTYFYVLKVRTLAGIWDVYKGYVTLLRSRM